MIRDRVAIVGGTGTLGNALMDLIYDSSERIVVLSRDELKQQKMRAKFPKAEYVLCDIRDRSCLSQNLRNINTVFHVAALKHVDVLQDNAMEAVKTNILGAFNVSEACLENNVAHCVFSSTDKAVLPVNVYGMTKGISEQYLLSLNKGQDITNFSVYRWGNVFGSRGSVVHKFKESLKKDGVVYLTHKDMTRFWINIDIAAAYILETYRYHSDKIRIPPMKAASVERLSKMVANYMGISEHRVEVIGIRPGEKIHECIHTSHDHCIRSDTAEQYSDTELLDLVRKGWNVEE